MTFVKEFTSGKQYAQANFSKEEAMAKIQTDKDDKKNSSFRIIEKNVIVDVKNQGKTFQVSTYRNEYSGFSTMVDSYKEIDSIERLAELIADFSLEKMVDFKTDEEYTLRRLLQHIPQETRDAILFDMLRKELPGKEITPS